MRNLILFLTKYYYFILFLLLESFSFFLIVQNNHYQRAHFLNSSNAIAGNIYETYSEITDYFSLKFINKELAEENNRLHNLLNQHNTNGQGLICIAKDSVHAANYLYTVAKVISNSTNRRKNYFTINAGSNQGIKKEMGVICSNGIAGIILDVSNNFSSAMSILHESARIPVIIKRFGENAILTWDGSNERMGQIERVPSHLDISKGDTIITSSNSSIFPEGIMVGTILSFEKIAGNTFVNLTIQFSTNFNQLHYVNIIINKKIEEQKKLELTTQHD